MRALKSIGAVLLVLVTIAMIALVWALRDQSVFRDVGVPYAQSAESSTLSPAREESKRRVTVTWLGLTTLVFDDRPPLSEFV